MLQKTEDIEAWYTKEDPWSYESNEHDRRRKDILLSEIPHRDYQRVLDIGCGHGFITRELPGAEIIGVDISAEAIKQAQKSQGSRIAYLAASLFELPRILNEKFDLIIITGVLYPQYIGHAVNLVYLIIDNLLMPDGLLFSVHIDAWSRARFPFILFKEFVYPYREFNHRLEGYIK